MTDWHRRCTVWNQDQIVLVEGARQRLRHISRGTGTAGLETPKPALKDSRYVLETGCARRCPGPF